MEKLINELTWTNLINKLKTILIKIVNESENSKEDIIRRLTALEEPINKPIEIENR